MSLNVIISLTIDVPNSVECSNNTRVSIK